MLSRRAARGFTLLELLVVISIIAILVGLLMPVLANIRRSSQESATRVFMESITTACAAYELDWGFYPPDGHNPNVTGKKPSGGAIPGLQSSSSLYYHLCTPFRVLPQPLKGEVGSNKDAGTYLTVAERYLHDLGGNRFEITDYWKHPLQYDNVRDPDVGGTPNGFNDTGATEIRTQATQVKNPSSAGRNPQWFDMWSAGYGSDGTAANSTRPLANFKCLWEGN